MESKPLKNKAMKQLLIIAAILLASCSPQKRITRLTQKHPELIPVKEIIKRDTSYIEKIQLKEVPVILPGEDYIIEVPIDCPDQEIMDNKAGGVSTVAEIRDGKIKIVTVIKTDTVYVKVPEKTTEITGSREEVLREYIKIIPKVYKILSAIGLLTILALIAYLVWRSKKFFS